MFLAPSEESPPLQHVSPGGLVVSVLPTRLIPYKDKCQFCVPKAEHRAGVQGGFNELSGGQVDARADGQHPHLERSHTSVSSIAKLEVLALPR